MPDTKDLPALAWSGHCVYGDDASIKAVHALVRTADRVAGLEDEIKQLRQALRDEKYQGGQDWSQMAADVDYGRGR